MPKSFRNIVLLAICLSINGIIVGQNKYVIIKTNCGLLKKKKIHLYGTEDELTSSINSSSYDYDAEIKFNRICLSRFSGDTLIVKIERNIPIIFQGLRKIKGDTIVIENIPTDKYIPIDTIETSTLKYKDSISSNSHSENKTAIPNNSNKFSDKNGILMINHNSYSFHTKSEPYNYSMWACSPGHLAIHQYVEGVRKFYIVNL
jgi:hypothetical protein